MVHIAREPSVKVKIFSQTTNKKTSHQLLEQQINDWLAANPTARPVFAEKLAHPTFGWGQIVVSVWYDEG
jgi:hypothetical protein